MRYQGFLILTLIAVSTGCSSPDADAPMPQITFEGVASKRHSPTTTETIDEFSVTAYYPEGHGFTTLLDAVTVKRTGPDKWSYSPGVDWPAAPVNFLAVSPAHNKINVNYWWRNIIQDYVCTGAEDLLIATHFNVRQDAGNICLNFRHTLAQVHVGLFTRNTDSRIMVHKVYLRDIPSQGNYYLPSTTTYPFDDNDSTKATGTWDTFSKSDVTYTIFKTDNDTVITDEIMHINSDRCFFLPGELDPLEHSGYYHGSRIEVLYQVFAPESDALLWPSGATPVQDVDREEPQYAVARYSLLDGLDTTSWHQGWSYNYTAELIPGISPNIHPYAKMNIKACEYNISLQATSP